ncbi:MAG: Gfo/Idh/MocA family protein, partial [Rubrobacteraceae bacterium]
MHNEPLRLGILGAARIALGGIIPASVRTDAVEVAAVATRGGEKSRAVREAAPEAHLFEDYGALLEDRSVEAVYIPLPNSMHVEWTLRSLSAGKHVLCEKPFSLDAGGAERAVQAAREAGLTLMEGFMFRLHPQTLRLREFISGGAAGEVRQAMAQFGHLLDDPSDVRGIGSLSGGSLGDVGCYCVSALRLVFGSEPRRASAFAQFDEEGADMELAGVLEFDAGFGVVSSS